MATRAKKATTKVDTPVENQENPGVSENSRPSTDTKPQTPEVPKMAAANKVDDTVVNQESPGSGEMVDRQPDPVISEDSNGIKYDVSKPYPELIVDNEEDEKRRARIRQTEGALNAKDLEGEDSDKDRKKIEITFLATGLTSHGSVWKAGQVLSMDDTEDNRKANEDTEGNVWYELSADEQKERYGKVFFEKR